MAEKKHSGSRGKKYPLSPNQLGAEARTDPIVQDMISNGVPLTRANYLRHAGYVDEPGPEQEAQLPA
jgi:hypothetical protein